MSKSRFIEIIKDIWQTLKSEIVPPEIFSLDLSLKSEMSALDSLRCSIIDTNITDFKVSMEEKKISFVISNNLEDLYFQKNIIVHEDPSNITLLNVEMLKLVLQAPITKEERVIFTEPKVRISKFEITFNLKRLSTDHLLKNFYVIKYPISNVDKSEVLNTLVNLVKTFNIDPKGISIIGVFKGVPLKSIDTMIVNNRALTLRFKSTEVETIEDIIVVREKNSGKIFFYPLKIR